MSNTRRDQALETRIAAAKLAFNRDHPAHVASGDELKFSGAEEKYAASFTKGLPHDKVTGLIDDERAFRLFVYAIRTGEPADFINTPLGPDNKAKTPQWQAKANRDNKTKVRAWESQGAGLTFDLEGPDAQAITMPPAPALGSAELTAEMAEVYAQALLRDVPFKAMMEDNLSNQVGADAGNTAKVDKEVTKLNKLTWFNNTTFYGLTAAERSRRRGAGTKFGAFNRQNVFRGQTFGDGIGPYISQFMLAGNKGLDGTEDPKDGFIQYGSIRIDQRVRVAKEGVDYMKSWVEWLDVQNGAAVGVNGLYTADKAYRFIGTPRDLATFVHHDALYEAYLNACLLLLGSGAKFDPGIPYQDADHIDHQQAFAHFGGPHILSLLPEVATRALKAVRYQKFNVHRRLRPEALGGRLEKWDKMPKKSKAELEKMFKALQAADFYGANGNLVKVNGTERNNRLLPMAFPEGSPMHPAYGAGHATVAGACVTILKAFFDHSSELDLTDCGSNMAFVAATDGKSLEMVKLDECLTVEGELNKLASNISIGRNWAGVHYYTDYIESLRMGEEIALGILEEQKLTYNEAYSMTVPLFDGGCVTI